MILMPRESRAASEGLLAIGIWTLIRSLARVDAAVTSERAAIREWLVLQSVCGSEDGAR